MPRMRLQWRVGTLLGVLALAASSLGPLVRRAEAAPPAQEPAPPAIVVVIDEPTHRAGVSATRLLVRGWAVNPASQRGTGVARVDLYLDGGPDTGGQYLGQANYGRERPDVAAALGPQFLASGWDLAVDLPRGPHTLIAIAAPPAGEPTVVLPGVASVHATVGGMAGRTTPGCGAGGYCSSEEGGYQEMAGPGWNSTPLYAGNQYVAYGAFGHGQTTPPYGWWDAQLPALMPYLLAWAANTYPYPQLFYGSQPTLYSQALLTQLSSQGVLGTLGTCFAPAFGNMDTLSLSVFGGYSLGFPVGTGGIRSTLSGQLGLGTLGTWNAGNGSFPQINYAGSINPYYPTATGVTGAWNGGLTSLSSMFGGRVSGPGGVGGAIHNGGGNIYPGYWVSETMQRSACIQGL